MPLPRCPQWHRQLQANEVGTPITGGLQDHAYLERQKILTVHGRNLREAAKVPYGIQG